MLIAVVSQRRAGGREDVVVDDDENEIANFCNDDVVIDDGDEVVDGKDKWVDEESGIIIWISSSTTLETCFIKFSFLFQISPVFNWFSSMNYCLLFI